MYLDLTVVRMRDKIAHHYARSFIRPPISDGELAIISMLVFLFTIMENCGYKGTACKSTVVGTQELKDYTLVNSFCA